MSNELTDVRCPCGAEFQADSYDAGFIAGSGMCQNCDAALPPKDICTCPSGDGSLRWPCPKHPAVEQAGGDERAACNLWIAEQQLCQGSDISLFKLERNGALVSLHDLLRDAYQAGQARAALAQPSPAPDYFAHADKKLEALLNATALILESPGHDAAHYWAKCLREYDEAHAQVAQARHVPELDPLNLAPHAGAFNEAPAEALKPEQAEAERPEVVAHVDGSDEDWFIQPEDETELHNEGLLFAGCELGRMVDFDRIVGELRAEIAMLRSYESELVAWVEVIDRDYGPYNFHGKRLLPKGKHQLYAAPVAQAQHSVPIAPEFKRALGLVVATLEADGDRPTSKYALSELKKVLAAAPGKEEV